MRPSGYGRVVAVARFSVCYTSDFLIRRTNLAAVSSNDEDRFAFKNCSSVFSQSLEFQSLSVLSRLRCRVDNGAMGLIGDQNIVIRVMGRSELPIVSSAPRGQAAFA